MDHHPEWCEKESTCLQPGKLHPDDISEGACYIFELMAIVDAGVQIPLDDIDYEILQIVGWARRQRERADTADELNAVWGKGNKTKGKK